jgi:hypothetical protein
VGFLGDGVEEVLEFRSSVGGCGDFSIKQMILHVYFGRIRCVSTFICKNR